MSQSYTIKHQYPTRRQLRMLLRSLSNVRSRMAYSTEDQTLESAGNAVRRFERCYGALIDAITEGDVMNAQRIAGVMAMHDSDIDQLDTPTEVAA